MPADKVLPVFLLVVLAVRLPHAQCTQSHAKPPSPCTRVCECDYRWRIEDYTVPVGGEVRVVLAAHGKYGWLSIGLCSRDSCSSINVADESRNNDTLEFQVVTTDINAIQVNYERGKEFRSSITGFAKGKNYTFVMQRANNESFAFWMESEPSVRLTVKTKPDELKFKWDSSVGDIYTIPEVARGDHVLPEGEEIGLVLETSKIRDAGLDIGLCGPSSCDTVSIYNLVKEPQPRLAYKITRSPSNTIYTGRQAIIERQGPAGNFPFNTYTFMIRRRLGAVEVWLDRHPDSRISFASSNDILRVRSWVGSTYLEQGLKEEKRKMFGTTCGRAKPAAESLVVNGKKASVARVPWNAGIYREINGVWKRICEGTLVAPSTIVTAAHCVATSSGRALPASQFAVALGKTYSGWDAEESNDAIQKYEVENIHVPAWYRGQQTKLANDIAVLGISACAKLNDTVFPVCVDRSFQGDEMKPLKIPGWSNSSPLSELETVDLPFLSNEGCKEYLNSNVDEFAYITGDKLCSYRNTAKEGSQGVLSGDSGSGAVFQHDGLWYLQGVVSGKLSVVKKGVGVDVYTFTNVIHHLDWIERFMSW